jgi:Domain of unknown function (DUF4436)
MAIPRTPSASAESRAKGDPKPSAGRRNFAISIGILLGVGVCYAGLLMYYRAESEARFSEIQVGDASAPDRLDVSARLLSVDQQQDQAVVRLSFDPKGSVANADGGLATPLTLYVNSANANQQRVFDERKVMSSTDVTLDLYDGSITDYPFDRFSTELHVAATTPASSGPEVVPVTLYFAGALHGLRVDASEQRSDETGGLVSVGLTISRSLTAIVVASFVMGLLLAMGLSVLMVTLAVLLWGRKLEPPIIALLGALLFGFVAFRNALPGTPPLGALSDYLSFFWAEGMVAACLFILVGVYLKRMHRPSTAP